MSVTTGHRQWYRCAMAYSQVVSVTTSAQTITLDGSPRWLEFKPLGAVAATIVTVSTGKTAPGVPIPAVAEAADMHYLVMHPGQVLYINADGDPSFSIIAGAAVKVSVRGVDV